jgi:proteasome assembly chaperone (PAC2) family protein
MKETFKFSSEPKFDDPLLVVAWNKDAGGVGPSVLGYLNEKMEARSFCEIEPVGFYSLGGVAIEDNEAQFPSSRFYCGKAANLVIFEGCEPQYEKYEFLNTVLDVAEHYCKAREMVTVNGTVTPLVHTRPRSISAVYNQADYQKKLREYGLGNMDWTGPPATSSYLLWVAARRGLAAVSLWAEIPFYLAAVEDLRAAKAVLAFIEKKQNLSLGLSDLDGRISGQEQSINRLRRENSEIDEYISALENNAGLTDTEQMELIKAMTVLLQEP